MKEEVSKYKGLDISLERRGLYKTKLIEVCEGVNNTKG